MVHIVIFNVFQKPISSCNSNIGIDYSPTVSSYYQKFLIFVFNSFNNMGFPCFLMFSTFFGLRFLLAVSLISTWHFDLNVQTVFSLRFFDLKWFMTITMFSSIFTNFVALLRGVFFFLSISFVSFLNQMFVVFRAWYRTSCTRKLHIFFSVKITFCCLPYGEHFC